MDKLTNARKAGALVLPNGVEIAAGAVVEIAAAVWATIAVHPIVAAWIATGDLVHTAATPAATDPKGPKGAKGPATKAGTPPPDPGTPPVVDPLS